MTGLPHETNSPAGDCSTIESNEGEARMTKLVALAVAAAFSVAGLSAATAKTRHHVRHHTPAAQNQQFNSSSAGMRDLNNPTPTRNDPPGTRTQCRGGCN